MVVVTVAEEDPVVTKQEEVLDVMSMENILAEVARDEDKAARHSQPTCHPTVLPEAFPEADFMEDLLGAAARDEDKVVKYSRATCCSVGGAAARFYCSGAHPLQIAEQREHKLISPSILLSTSGLHF